jgi:hypothetical protein
MKKPCSLSRQLDKPPGRHDGRLAPETLEISGSPNRPWRSGRARAFAFPSHNRLRLITSRHADQWPSVEQGIIADDFWLLSERDAGWPSAWRCATVSRQWQLDRRDPTDVGTRTSGYTASRHCRPRRSIVKGHEQKRLKTRSALKASWDVVVFRRRRRCGHGRVQWAWIAVSPEPLGTSPFPQFPE